MQTSVKTSSQPIRPRTTPQSGLAASASRPAFTAHSTGLYVATLCIHPGMSARAMNTELRNVSGSSTKLLTATMVSTLRQSTPMALLSAPTPVPSSTAPMVSAAMPATPPGYSAPTMRPSTTMMTRLDDADQRALHAGARR